MKRLTKKSPASRKAVFSIEIVKHTSWARGAELCVFNVKNRGDLFGVMSYSRTRDARRGAKRLMKHLRGPVIVKDYTR